MLKIKDIHKRYGKIEVLKGVDLEVAKGDVVVILGPSGSGKTTLLRSINFLERADYGTMIFDEKEYHFQKAKKKEIAEIRKKSAFVFQNYNLFQNKTALENVTEGLIIGRRVPKKIAIEKAKSILDKVGLSDRYDFYPAQLSGGQQQRVGIARAIAVDPGIILFDEPTSALDPELIGEVLLVMKQLAAEGTTMVIVTHEIAFAEEVATQVIFMDEGKVVEAGSADEVIRHPKQERTKLFLRRITKDMEYVI